MELKFRKKGKIITLRFGGFIPSEMNAPESMDIDLTGYSVIHACFGKHGDKKAKELHDRASQTIVVYEYEWRNGWGEGIILPSPFDSRRVKFYKTEERKEREKKEEELSKMIDVLQNEFPQYEFSPLRHWKMVDFYASTVEEIINEVREEIYNGVVIDCEGLGMIEVTKRP